MAEGLRCSGVELQEASGARTDEEARGLANAAVGGWREGWMEEGGKDERGGGRSVSVEACDCKSGRDNVNRRPAELCFLLKEHTTNTRTQARTHTHMQTRSVIDQIPLNVFLGGVSW